MKYKDLIKRVAELEKQLHFKNMEVQNTHEICDKLDVPKHDSAMVGHRLYWFSEGKRESYKTKENTEGYPPEEHERRMRELEELRTSPPAAEEKKNYQHKFDVLGDDA